ncbi:MAG TPA: elongation factor G, partial [Spirochaetota bacterium]|nr:elongation factor G [Spirochaetota bacterium]
DRLKHEFDVEALIGEPSVAFRETITAEVESNYRHVKQTGGKGQFAHTVMRVEPNDGKGFEFVDHIKGGVIPAEFIPSIEKGIKSALEEGILAGFPVVDVRVVLLDGNFHPVDSSDMAFRTCAAICFKEGFMKAKPILLEPLMKIEVNTPDDYIGDVVGDLNKRRGRIESMRRYRKGSQKVNGFVPLMEMFGYATQLRNISSGRANYSMEFFKYVPLSKNVQERVLKDLQEKKKTKK